MLRHDLTCFQAGNV